MNCFKVLGGNYTYVKNTQFNFLIKKLHSFVVISLRLLLKKNHLITLIKIL